jgi:hypothetical protein
MHGLNKILAFIRFVYSVSRIKEKNVINEEYFKPIFFMHTNVLVFPFFLLR